MSGPGRVREARGRRLLRAAGVLIALASVAFVALRLRGQVEALGALATWRTGLLLIGLSLPYAASLLLISHAFWLLLSWQGVEKLGLGESHRIYGSTQLAKYLPGNVFHFVARHMAYRTRGASDRSLAFALLYENLGLLGAAACLGVFALPDLARGALAAQLGQTTSWVTLGLGLAAFAVALWGLPRLSTWLARRRGQTEISAGVTPRRWALVLPFYIGFFLVSGVLALGLQGRASDGTVQFSTIPRYAMAWLCGFAIPGASAGLGVREAVIVLLLGEGPVALFVALGMRVVTTLGDLILFAGATSWSRSLGRSEGPARS